MFRDMYLSPMGFPGGPVVENPPINAGDTRDMGLIPGLGISMDRGSWQTTVQGVAKSWT